jgi:hypothetical protein
VTPRLLGWQSHAGGELERRLTIAHSLSARRALLEAVSVAKALDGREDIVGGLRPHERLWATVGDVEAGAARALQFDGTAMGPATQLAVRELGEEAFDLVDPGGALRREMDMKARVAEQRLRADAREQIATVEIGRGSEGVGFAAGDEVRELRDVGRDIVADQRDRIDVDRERGGMAAERLPIGRQGEIREQACDFFRTNVSGGPSRPGLRTRRAASTATSWAVVLLLFLAPPASRAATRGSYALPLHGLKTGIPVGRMSAVFRVAKVNPCCSAVAASCASTVASVTRCLFATASSCPQRSATPSSKASSRPAWRIRYARVKQVA